MFGHRLGRDIPANYYRSTGTMQYVPTITVTNRETTARAAAPSAAQRLVADTAWLLEHIDSVVVIDTRPAADFAQNHISGARSMPLSTLLVDNSSRPNTQRLATLIQQLLSQLGVSPAQQIVLVDDGDGSASLGATLCELAGMHSVTALLDDVSQWHLKGCEMSTGFSAPSTHIPTNDWRMCAPRTDVIATFEDLIDAVVDGSARIVDTRSQLEHEGIVGAPCCRGHGSIPGSIHFEWTQVFDMFGQPRPVDALRGLLADVGIFPTDRIITTCHAGHRAATTARVLRSAGFTQTLVSIGSWHEWSLRGLIDD